MGSEDNGQRRASPHVFARIQGARFRIPARLVAMPRRRKGPRESKGGIIGPEANDGRPPGLRNLGNTCYFNACLQCLAALPEWVTAVRDAVQSRQDVEMPLTTALDEIMSQMRVARNGTAGGGSKGKGTLSPAAVLERVRRQVRQFRRAQQQDAHELFVQLLALVAGEESGRRVAEDEESQGSTEGQTKEEFLGAVGNVFGGETCSTVKCQTCKTSTFTVECSLSVSLEIPGTFGNVSQSRRPKTVAPANNAANPFSSLLDESPSSESDTEGVAAPSRPIPTHTTQKLNKNQKHRAKRKARRARRKRQGKSLDKGFESLQIDTPVPVAETEAETKGEAEIEEAKVDEADSSGLNGHGDFTLGSGNEDVAPEEDKGGEHRDRLASYDPPVEVSFTALCEAAASPVISLRQCFEAYCAKERLRVEDGNGFRCDVCVAEKSDAWKRFALLRCPKVLVVHLKRLLFGTKVSKRVTFERELDVASFCMTPQGLVPSIRYRLAGVIEHQGSASHGHYVAFVDISRVDALREETTNTTKENGPNNSEEGTKEDIEDKAEMSRNGNNEIPKETTARVAETRVESKWFHMSDSNVYPVDENRVMKAQAYMLFYVRI